MADGHSEYFGQGSLGSSRQRCTVLAVAEIGEYETFIQHLRGTSSARRRT
jgi:hypothetical protein